ncbi:MAG: hypothetical protein JNK09_14350 [Prolixibacteraceae bacterium]|nr:hypothetical protein [Prolixibacteraceae bacterium]
MKKLLLFLISGLVITACSTVNKIVEVDDSFKGIKTIKLKQEPDALSVTEKSILGGRYSYTTKVRLISEAKSGEIPTVVISFELVTGIRADELDSILFFDLDQEKIKITSVNYSYKQFQRSSSSESTTTSTESKIESKNTDSGQKTTPAKTVTTQTSTTESGTYQLMSRRFIIPENLWIPIVHSKRISYRIYLGSEGIDVKLSLSENARLKEFFNRVIQQRDKVRSGIPEGKMKW